MLFSGQPHAVACQENPPPAMQETLLALSLLTITGVTGIIARVLNLHIPMPLLQIAAGATAALAGLNVGLDNNLFLLLFISPLLFVDAYRIPMREFGELRHIIAAMSVGLVVLSTTGGGYFLHWLLPAISLAAAFALAGALSPTDAISVSGILRGGRVPPRILYLLSGEALLNDASGLVCFKFAVAAATTGLFSLKAASANFVWVALGGILTGIVIGMLSSRLEIFLLRRGYDDPPSHALLALMIPFAVYLAAEHISTSGILAVVAGGMTIRLTGVMNETQIETRMRATAIWDMVSFTLNGLVFLLLGLQLPHLVQEAQATIQSEGLSLWSLLLAILGLQAVMTLIRLIWVTLSAFVRQCVARLRHIPCVVPSWGEKLVLALAGTRGTITLAAILTLPPATDFPERALLITLAAGVIISSLIMASLLLPFALRLLPLPSQITGTQQELDATRLEMVNVALMVLKNETTRSKTDAAAPTDAAEIAHAVPLLLQEYQELQQTLDSKQPDPGTNREMSLRNRRTEVAIRLRIIRAQRKRLRELLHDRKINDETERLLSRQLDVHEQELLNEAAALPHA
ncbi:Na+/H+ antiporter [Acetobacter indonesiensis NRIC 0313]|uniref:Antiporter of Na+/H+ NhaA/NhaP n=1 Tax=Acetobacter indonesiensis TaxID=104101 RepID=A0A6N3T5G2_9PROT|nr:Na+/H+ antiporter [Acetobacter indonesiensis]MCP1230454.1 Na+/H+ antiporter [Acetobacter indonesiensis]GAN61954.1 antiporter of Na+/H+ NhaA/NhaP [Acetobacter indonesiensis]GBQ57111.1 Na+/H+ antiporter [Acetobacter indonesiensis NRIC 0313]GEN04531.1 sodium/hydrogen antiporter [Acetobacter indonesiensis]